MSRKSRDKGQRIEREIVQRHKDIGIHAERVPLSGAAGGSYTGDVLIHLDRMAGLISEVKARKNGSGFTTIENWLSKNDVLFLRRDRAEPLVVMPWSTWEKLVSPDVGAAA